MFQTVRTTFQSVKTQRVHTGKCPVCGGKTKRSRMFEHTVSPFNKNPDGSIRTVEEVRENLYREADAWVPDFTHGACAQ